MTARLADKTAVVTVQTIAVDGSFTAAGLRVQNVQEEL